MENPHFSMSEKRIVDLDDHVTIKETDHFKVFKRWLKVGDGFYLWVKTEKARDAILNHCKKVGGYYKEWLSVNGGLTWIISKCFYVSRVGIVYSDNVTFLLGTDNCKRDDVDLRKCPTLEGRDHYTSAMLILMDQFETVLEQDEE